MQTDDATSPKQGGRPPLDPLPEGVSVWPVPRLLRWGKMRDQYDFHPSGLVVFSCADPAWPVQFAANVGDRYDFRASPETVRRIIDVLHNRIPPLEAARKALPRRWGLFSPKPEPSQFEVGDDILIAFQRGRWGLKRRGVGMGLQRLTEAERGALADVLSHLVGMEPPALDDSAAGHRFGVTDPCQVANSRKT